MTTPTEGSPRGRLILAGFGDIAARVARRAARNFQMTGINRSGRRCASMPPQLQMQRGDLGNLAQWAREGDTILWLAPPATSGDGDAVLETALAQLPRPERLVYLSTSGIYGDCQGRWVDESAPRAPLTTRARRRAAAEQAVERFAREMGCAYALVRVPGIYGPGRLPLARLREGVSVLSPVHTPWSNRVHAEDLAEFLQLVARRGQGIYNISDGFPGSISEYYLAIAEMLALPAPRVVDRVDQLPPSLQSYMRESRRLRIERATTLGFCPQFPDFLAALPACVDADLSWSD